MEGFPTRADMVATYERASGRATRDLEFYEVFAGLRFSVIMLRIATLIRDFGILPEDAAVELAANNAVTRSVADLLGLPAPGQVPGVFS